MLAVDGVVIELDAVGCLNEDAVPTTDWQLALSIEAGLTGLSMDAVGLATLEGVRVHRMARSMAASAR